jgi:Tc5 transposase DNA-binding domain
LNLVLSIDFSFIVKSGYFAFLENVLFQWIVEMRATPLPVTIAMICEKSLAIAKRLLADYKTADAETKSKIRYDQLSEFTASTGWYSKFADHFLFECVHLNANSSFLSRSRGIID